MSVAWDNKSEVTLNMCSKAIRNWTQCSPALDNGKKILMTPKFWLQAQNSMNKEQHTYRKCPWMSVIRKCHHLPTCSSVSEVLLLDIQHTQLPNHRQISHIARQVSTYPLPSLASSDITTPRLTAPWMSNSVICYQIAFILSLTRLLPCVLLQVFISFPKENKKQKVAVHYGH